MATVTKPILLDETGKRIAGAMEAMLSQQSLIFLLTKSGLTDAIELDPTVAVYRATPTPSSGTVTIPTPDVSEIPVASAYFCFDLEITVDSGATTLVGPASGTDFDSTATYALGDCVIYNGKLYECTTAHTGDWNAEDFTEIEGAALSWTFLDGGEIPDATDAAGKTMYISCRLDCTTRTVVAQVWRVA